MLPESLSPRRNPPRFAGIIAALLSSLARDLQPVLEGIPHVSESTASLGLILAGGVLGGVVGRVSERWTVPFVYNPHDTTDPGERD